MTARSRTAALVIAAVVVGAPPAIMRAFCLGDLCEDENAQGPDIPFCSLPGELRARVANGFREGRSPNVMAVTGTTTVLTKLGGGRRIPAWSSTESVERSRVPLVFWGTGVSPDAAIPEGTRVDTVAPTIAEIIGLDRPHPEVRSGTALTEVVGGEPPRLVIEVVLEGWGSADLEAATDKWPHLESLIEQGAATFDADTGSLPLDPASVLTTIGTGALPRQHGIVGTLLRNDAAELVRAWDDPNAPVSVTATLGDDLDELNGQRPLVGLAAPDPSARGIIGGNWYVDVDEDEVVYSQRDQFGAAFDLLDREFGSDDVPDLLAVVVRPGRNADRRLGRLVEAARDAARDALTIVITGTGSSTYAHAVDSTEVVATVEDEIAANGQVVEASGSGGLFVNQKTLADNGISEEEVTRALREITSNSGGPLVTDAFPAIAVSFSRYC